MGSFSSESCQSNLRFLTRSEEKFTFYHVFFELVVLLIIGTVIVPLTFNQLLTLF